MPPDQSDPSKRSTTFDDEQTDPARRPTGQRDEAEPASLPQGSQPSLTIPSDPAWVERSELCWLDGGAVEVQDDAGAVVMVLLNVLRIRATADEAATLGRALLRAAHRARRR